jgi:hypothetical protein
VAFAYDFGARMYDARLGRWLSLDPLEKKYPYLSPYHFCNNNPILYKDFDGRDFITYVKLKNSQTGKSEIHKVTFDGTKTMIENVKTGAIGEYNGGSKFVDDMITSYNYIVENGADIDDAMKTIASSKDIHIIVEESKSGGGQYKNGKIIIDLNVGLEIYDNETDKHKGNQSPALGFWSEVYHAYIDKIDNIAKEKYKNVDNEEEYVHVEKEQKVIDKLKKEDPTNKETKRKTYGEAQWKVKTKGPTSTEKK